MPRPTTLNDLGSNAVLAITDAEADAAQNWKGMDGAIAWHLIERHADGWGDVGAMMNAWLRANGGTVANSEITGRTLAQNEAADGRSDLTAVLDDGGKCHTMRVMSSSEDMTWATPQEWFDYLNLEFGFTLDPCCLPDTAKCKRYYTPETDGLSQSWADERVFMNPPYGREIGKWMKKAYEEARDSGALVVCFVPARVDTNWWHSFAAKATEVRFPKGRVKNPTGIAWPFPVAVVVFRPRG